MQKKKNKKKLNYANTYNSGNEVSRIIKILVGILLFLAIFYFLALLATGEIKFGNKKKTEEEKVTEIQYEEILAGQTFTQKEEEYYVLYFNFTDSIGSTYLTYRDGYINQIDSLPMYMVDLEKGFNTRYLKEEETDYKNKPDSINDLKVINPTVLKVKKHKVVERIEGKEEVKKFLKELN